MLYTIVFFIIAIASFVFAMLGLDGGMVYVPVLNWAGFDMVKVAIPLGLLLNGLNTALVLIPLCPRKNGRLERRRGDGCYCSYCSAFRGNDQRLRACSNTENVVCRHGSRCCSAHTVDFKIA